MAIVPPPPVSCRLAIPPEHLASVIGSWPEPALLESGPGFATAGRWSLLTARPRFVFEATGDKCAVRTPDGRTTLTIGDPLQALGRYLDTYGLADPRDTPDPELPPFQGGLVGFFGYDLAPRLERLPRRAPRESALPDVRFALYDTVVTVDHLKGDVVLWAYDLLDEGYAATARRGREWSKALAKQRPAPARTTALSPLRSNFTYEGYLDAARRALEYIAAGDVFQVNLSQRFHCVGKPAPLDLYLRLKERSPAPFSTFLAWENAAVVSASPEWFYQTRGDAIVTRPIKGTRPRGASHDDDERLAAELAQSPKDRAELTMIVDLERNDLGRVCRYGTVRVSEALTVETFAQVHHLVATVEGRLRPETAPMDIVRALFPGGSITGAPKIRAMEIIDELEPTRRSLYTGAIGYFSRGGTSAFNIAIRTMLIEGNLISFQAGGGIVADSDPETEYHETLHKARGMRAVIEET
ncbi:MAG: aminodeoxychorismate synthase component I [Isosphaeraceae bacterium]|nr:aminodeoxychorismate synthase component I [Isosphaeraceae bacterium]